MSLVRSAGVPFTASSSRTGVPTQGDKGIHVPVPQWFPERQHAAQAPRLVRRQKHPRRPGSGHAGTYRPPYRPRPHPAPCLTHSSRNSIQSQQTPLKALRLAVCPEGRRAVAKSGIPGQVNRGRRRVPGPHPSPLVLLRSWRAAVTCDTYSSAHAYGVDAAWVWPFWSEHAGVASRAPGVTCCPGAGCRACLAEPGTGPVRRWAGQDRPDVASGRLRCGQPAGAHSTGATPMPRSRCSRSMMLN